MLYYEQKINYLILASYWIEETLIIKQTKITNDLEKTYKLLEKIMRTKYIVSATLLQLRYNVNGVLITREIYSVTRLKD